MLHKKLKIACVILASGSSLRFGTSKSKIFYKVHGTPIIEITLKNISKYINKNSIYITIPQKITKNEKKLISRYSGNQLISGGKTRFESLRNALKIIDVKVHNNLMVHDAVRPIVPKNIILSLLKSISNGKYNCAVPASVVEDTLRKNNKTMQREKYKVYQTPQIFNLNYFMNNLKTINKIPTDDLGVIENNKNTKINYVETSKSNIKITRLEDIITLKKLINYKTKYGSGFDIHKLKKGKHLAIAGLKIYTNYESVGHSDGDVVLHSIIDALLGTQSKGDIGDYFPALKKYKGISSVILLESIIERFMLNKSIISNLDCTIICQKIRLNKFKKEIVKNLASLLNCKEANINVKAKTTDNIGIIGKSRAIACWTTIKLIEL